MLVPELYKALWGCLVENSASWVFSLSNEYQHKERFKCLCVYCLQSTWPPAIGYHSVTAGFEQWTLLVTESHLLNGIARHDLDAPPVLQEVGGIQNSNLMSRKSIAFEIAPKSLTWCNVSDSLRKNGAGVCEHQCNCLPLFQNHSPSFEHSILQNKHLWASMPLTWGVFCIFTVCNMWTICKTTLASCTTKEQNDQSAYSQPF